MDVASILIIAVCGAIGIYIRYEARESRRPWLVTVVLAAVFLAFSLLKHPGERVQFSHAVVTLNKSTAV